MRTEDGHIVYQCLEGEPSAFGLLVDKYKGSIFALAYSKLGNFHDAEDATQEVFIKAYRKLKSLKRQDNFLAWMYAITSNLCKDWLRARNRHTECELDEDKGILAINSLSMKSYQDDKLYDSLNDALDTLPETYRQVLILHYLGGMSGKEIARFLGTSQNAILLRLSRARGQLREEMAEMMRTYETRRLPVSFTFRIVEAIKGIRINSIPRIPWISWGASFTIGIIFVLLSLGSSQFGVKNYGKFADLYNELTFTKPGLPFPISVIDEKGLLALAQAPDEKGQNVGSNEKQGSSGQDQKDQRDQANQASVTSAGEVETLTVSGKILRDDRPAKNVKINVYLYDTELKYESITGDDGAFEIKVAKPNDGLIWERIAVVAYQPGYSFNWKELRKDEISDIIINLLKPAVISGTVTDDSGKPIQGAQVSAYTFSFGTARPYTSWLAGDTAPNSTTTTDEDGKFIFRNLPEGVKAGIQVENQGYARQMKYQISAGTEGIIFELKPEARIEGRITYGDPGKPADKITVYAQAIYPNSYNETTKTDDNGYYTFTNMHEGQYHIMPRSGMTEWVAMPKQVKASAGETVKNVDLELIRGAVINGKVLEKDTDKPIPDVWVGWVNTAHTESQGSAQTDKDGNFSLRATPGKVSVSLNSLQEYAPVGQVEKTLEVVNNQTISDVNFYFQKVKTLTIKGSVINIDGEPIPNAVISDAADFFSQLALSDSDGKFEIKGQRSGKKLTVNAKQSDMKLKGYAEMEAQPDYELEIVVQEYETTSVTGRIVNQKGEPVPSADIGIVRWEGGGGLGTSAGLADGSGHYVINDLVVGDEYYVNAGNEGYRGGTSERFIAAKDMKPLPDIALKSAGKFYLEGFVKDTDGKPVGGARVTARSDQSQARTDENGYYIIENLPNVVEIEVGINHPEYGFSRFNYIPTNETHNFVIKKPNGYLAGKVVDADGNPVEAATVMVDSELPTDWEESGHVNFAFSTDANGRFKMENLLVNKKENIYVGKSRLYKIFKDVEMNRDDVVFILKEEPAEPSKPSTADQLERRKYRDEADKRANSGLVGKPAPEFEVDQWLNGKPVDLAKLKGRTVILQLWSYFNTDSEGQVSEFKKGLEKIRFINTLQKAFADKGVIFVSIHGYTTEIDRLKKLVKERNPAYNMAVDKKSTIRWASGVTLDKYGLVHQGLYVLIDRNGIIRHQTIWDHELEPKIQELISE